MLRFESSISSQLRLKVYCVAWQPVAHGANGYLCKAAAANNDS